MSCNKIIFAFCALLIVVVKSDDAVSSSAAESSSTTDKKPPVVAPPPPVAPVGGFPGGFGGLFPGFGGGFHKNLDISGGAGAGFGPWGGLGGLGGLGGVPPVPVEGAEGAGFGGPFGGFGGPFGGLLGPSYIPSTWLGSALGAKGDILFPLVIFVFFVVGVWTIVQFLLGLIVPLIASKVSVLKGIHKRDLTPEEQKEEQVNHLTNAVWAAFENFGCMKTSACYTGNIVHSLAGADKVNEYESTIDAMKIMDPEIVSIFKKAAQSGTEDCSKYPCHDKKGEHEHPKDNAV